MRRHLERPLPSEGRGWHGFHPFIAIYRSSKRGTSGERRGNGRGLHRSCTGALLLSERGGIRACGHSINSRAVSLIFQRVLSHVPALPPHGYLRRSTVCHNDAACQTGTPA